jgi:GNAT superfamily N-acetyltransferase
MHSAPEPPTIRVATLADLEAMKALMTIAIDRLQDGYLTPAQIALSHRFMGLDTQLVRDCTYFVAEIDGVTAGCGGWSYRATLYGGDASAVAREPVALDPARDPARVRAMYTSPQFTRRGVGRAILQASEDAARAAGFATAELMATMAGLPLYEACGYRRIESVTTEAIDGVSVPLERMTKTL